MHNRANIEWTLPGHPSSLTFEQAQLAVLMDIREQLRVSNKHLEALENIMRCPNVSRAAHAVIRLDRRAAKKVKLP